MPVVSHVASARFHRATSASHGAGAQAIADYLYSYVGDEYAVVEIERSGERFSLIVDSDWIRFAQSASKTDGDLIAGMDLPRNCIIAVAAGWGTDWSRATSDLAVEYSSDHIPHLRLTSLRPSTTGADKNSLPHEAESS